MIFCMQFFSIFFIFILSLPQNRGIIYLSSSDQLGGSNEKEIFWCGGFSFGSCCPRRWGTTWGGGIQDLVIRQDLVVLQALVHLLEHGNIEMMSTLHLNLEEI